jgi:gliding motility-associated-like protein
VPPPTHHRSDSVQVCAGDSIQVFGQWVTQAGVLNHTFSNIYGCDSVVDRTVQVLPQAAVLLQVKQPTCLAPLATLTLISGTPGAQFSLDGTHFTAEQTFEQLMPGNYALTALTDEGCAQQIPFIVQEIEYPTLQLPGDTSIDLGQSIRIKPIIYPVSQYVFDWTPIQYLNCNGCPEPVATPLQNTEYKLVITDEKGCTATDRIQIKVNGPDIYVPNIFTPDNDQENDAFTIYTASVGVRKILELQIFDRWGTLVFSRNDFEPNRDDLGWHGDYKGSPMNPGVFVWWAKLEFIDGQQVLLKGDVTLMR